MTRDMFDLSDVDEAKDHKKLFGNEVVNSLLLEDEALNEQSIEKFLPLVSFAHKDHDYFEIKTMSDFQVGSAKFIYEFIYSEIETHSELEIQSFCSLPYRFFELDTKKYIVTETVLLLKDHSSLDHCYAFIQGLQKQLRLGLKSVFYARMCMEMKGGSVDNKVVFVQERVMRYIHRFPNIYDYDLIPMMNEFMKSSKEVYTKDRMTKDLSRIVMTLYLISKRVSKKGRSGSSREMFAKARRFFVEEPFGRKRVLSVMLGLSHINENERLGKNHILKACRKFIPKAVLVDDSFKRISLEGEKGNLFYLEIEKKEGVISKDEELSLEENLVKYLEMHIQKFARKIFMPQNTEEVIKYTVALSKELKTKKDYPQVAVLFESQTNDQLIFTVIIVRAKGRKTNSAFDVFAKSEKKKYHFKINHVRMLGEAKEGIEMSYYMKISAFMREDYSVDIYKARARIIYDLQKRLGPVRDYNGGMLEKQGGALSDLQGNLRKKGIKNSVLIENFFYAIQPSELRAIISVKDLSQFFISFYDLFSYKIGREMLVEKIDSKALFVARVRSEKKKEAFLNEVKAFENRVGDLLFFTLYIQEKFYLGASFKFYEEEERVAFSQKMSLCLKH
ncbi:MAG: hypothetical protein S4CHLAM20_02700 [Chlamydiia bacterium]|nr:hypothetical protein [Chlamydiia bacterium]